MNKVLDKASDGMSFVKDGIDKVRQKQWAEPLGVAMGVTASICNGLGSFVPGLGMVGGAIQMGGKILNPAPSLADIKRSEKEILESLEGQTGIIKETLEKRLETIREEMKRPQSENVEDFQIVKKEVQSCVSAMTSDMRRLENELVDIKDIINHTFQLVRDMRYRDGIEKVESAYEIFLKGSNNLVNTLEQLQGFMFELQVIADQNLAPQRIGEYLRAILVNEDVEIAQQIFKYILVVRSKYLQLATAYYIYQQDAGRVAAEFESFNKDFDEMKKVFKAETGTDFQPDRPLTDDVMIKCRNTKKILPDVTQASQDSTSIFEFESIAAFLNDIGLAPLIDIFLEEGVTMDILKNCNDDDLTKIGVEKYGHRKIIIDSLSKIGASGT